MFISFVMLFSVNASEGNLLKNADFSEKDAKGKIAFWSTYTQTPLQSENSVLKSMVEHPGRKDGSFASAATQVIPVIHSGKCEFSGYYRGNIENLFVVLRAYGDNQKQNDIIQKWIPKKDFIKAGDMPGWYKFFFAGTIPRGFRKASVHLNGWGKKGEYVEFKNIELVEAEE